MKLIFLLTYAYCPDSCCADSDSPDAGYHYIDCLHANSHYTELFYADSRYADSPYGNSYYTNRHYTAYTEVNLLVYYILRERMVVLMLLITRT